MIGTVRTLLLSFWMLTSGPEAASGGPFWARQLGGSDREYATGVAVDGSGTVFVTGHFQRTSTIESAQLTSAGLTDVFVAALDPAGRVTWVRGLGGPGADEARGIAVGPQGEIYVTGFFSGAMDFDPGPGRTELTSAGSADVFLARLSPAGELVWARRLGGSLGDVGLAVAADGKGAVVTGYFQGAVEVPEAPAPRRLDSAGREDALAARFDASGKLLWARRIGGARSDEGRDVALAPDGTAWLAGSFEETAGFSPEGGSATLTSAGRSDGFLAHLDSAGRLVSALSLGGPGADTAEAVAAGATGVAVTGQFAGTVDFSPGATVAALSSAGPGDVFVARLSTTGQLAWARRLGGTREDFGYGIALDRSGHPVVASVLHVEASEDTGVGDTRSVLTFFGPDGESRLTRDLTAAQGLQALALALDAAGNPCVAGVFRGAATIPTGGGAGGETARLPGTAKLDVFVARISRQL